MTLDLQSLQRSLQKAIVDGSDDARLAIVGDATEQSERLGIYRTAYRARLIEALADSFPMFHEVVGDAFEDLAQAYIHAHPSRAFSIRAAGSRFADWLDITRHDEPWLCELARLEWLLGEAFDSPDEHAINAEDLSVVAAHEWPQLRFRFATCVRSVVLTTNAAALYEHAARGARVAGDRSVEPSVYLVWRQDLQARFRAMSTAEYTAFEPLARGDSFASACEQLLDRSMSQDTVSEQAVACLKRWLNDGLIVTFATAPA